MVIAPVGAAGDQGIGFVMLDGPMNLLLQRFGNAIDILKGVGKMGELKGLIGCCGLGRAEVPPHGFAEAAIFSKLGKGDKVGCQKGVEAAGRSDGRKDIK